MTIAFISHPDCLLHEMGSWHPERPERLHAIEDRLISSRLHDLVRRFDAPEATREMLERVHDRAYLDWLESVSPAEGHKLIDEDTSMNPHTLKAARRAAGAAVLGVELIARGEAEAAFCSVRPPGHHAERKRAMGFCFYDNVAVGAAHALATGLQRVAIADFDVHHGNGTEDIFRDDPRVLMVSTFQHPLYPHSGIEGRSERMVNVPLAAGSGGAEFRSAVEKQWLPALRKFEPQMLFISAGFDSHRDDGGVDFGTLLGLTEPDFAWVTRELRNFAGGKIVSVLEGGYDLGVLGRCAATHIEQLIGW